MPSHVPRAKSDAGATKAGGAVRIAIVGAGGRMGQRLVALARQDTNFEIVGAIERPDHPLLSRDAGEGAGIGPINLPLAFDLRPTPDVLIDFSAPPAMRHWLKTCRDRGIAMIIGTTGLHKVDHAAIDVAAEAIPVLASPNMSLGVQALLKAVKQVAAAMGKDCDIEIVETHHRFKKDAPSGTAMALADAVLKATGRDHDSLVFGRHGDDVPRKPGEVGIHSLRLGDEIGTHTVALAALGERLELRHVATNRDTFVRGALHAAAWLAKGRKPGRYTLADVLES